MNLSPCASRQAGFEAKGASHFTFWFALVICSLSFSAAFAQQVQMSDFVLFSGQGVAGATAPGTPGYAVQIGSSSTITGGSVGSLKLIKSTGNSTISGNLYSKGTIVLSNNNSVSGKIAASNAPVVAGTILSIGSGANIGGNIDVNGNIVVSSGTVSGQVTHPSGTTYTGPAPAQGNITGTPTLPTYPSLPEILNFPSILPQPDITTTRTITPGSYDDVKLSGNQTLTFGGPGVYVLDLIDNKNSNTFVFDFKNSASGTFQIYVHNNVILSKINTSIINGGGPTRIFTEVHGKGVGPTKYAFDISNGSSGGAKSRWSGTVWAPYATINIGSGTGNSEVTGALWSGTQVNIQSGVTIVYAPYGVCVPPVITATNPTVCSTADGGRTATIDLTQYASFTGGGTGVFSVGGSVISNPQAYLATNGDIVTFVVTKSPTCSSSATLTITVNDRQSFGICAPASGKTNDLIGSELTSLSQIYAAGGRPTSSEVFFIMGDKVMIDIIYQNGKLSELRPILLGMGLTDELVSDDGSLIITGFFPIVSLTQLNPMGTLINYVRPSFPPVSNISGIVDTQGDKALRSDLVRKGYNIGGAGIKIGVLSDSYNTLANTDVQNGELPGDPNATPTLEYPFGPAGIQVVKEYPYGSRSDEGRAMLQIIHDIAPQAKLAFRTGFITAGDFAKGIRELKAANCDIIVDDITYVTESFFKDGKVAEAVNEVTSQGVSYFTAAGNFGSKSYEGTFSPILKNGLTAHTFDGGIDAGQSITVGPGTYTIVMQWEDPVYSTASIGTQNDLDIYLTTDQGLTRFGFNRNNLGGDPIEVLPFTIQQTTTTEIMVVRAAGTQNIRFKYIVFRGDQIAFNEYNNNGIGYSTIVGQANAAGAMTVGAVLYSNTPAYGYTGPTGIEQFSVASFSSVGGMPVNNQDRNKPDFIAPNGVNTTVNFGKDLDDPDFTVGDGSPNFFGTSAAAPHAAAVAALLMEARNKFEPGLARYTPAEIRQVLKASAKNMYGGGYDVKSGAGFIRADVALMTVAAPDPAIFSPLVYDANVVPGDEPFTVTINGTGLNADSEVLLRGEVLESTYNEETGQLNALVPLFEGNPPLVVKNDSISTSGLDGGSSESLYFYGIAKKRIVLQADRKTKKYGERLPAYTASVLVEENGALVAGKLTMADVGLTNNPLGETLPDGRKLVAVTVEGPASDLIDVNLAGYALTPLPHGQAHVTYRELYTYDMEHYQKGALVVERLPLTITPNDLTHVYGEKFDDQITFEYKLGGPDYNLSNLDPETKMAMLESIQQQHGQQVYDNAFALVDIRQVGNFRQITNSDLSNLAFMSSERSLLNFRQITNSINVVDFDKQSIFNYRDGATDMLTYPIANMRQITNSRKAVVNFRQMVNGEALVNIRQIVNNEVVVNTRQIVNSGGSGLVNSETVGQGSESTNQDVLLIVDSLDVYSEPVINDAGEEVYEIPQMFSINMVTGVTAGIHSIVPGAFLSRNFDINYGLGTLTIDQAPLTITAKSDAMTYGEHQPNYYSTYAGFMYDDDTTSVIQSMAYSLTDSQGNPKTSTQDLDAGAFIVTPTATLIETELRPGDPVNYVVTHETGTLTVDKALVTATATSGQSKTYGEANPETFAYSITSGSLFHEDAFTGAVSRAEGENVGTYAIGLGTLALSTNYTLTYVPADFTITARPVTVSASAASKTYGDADLTLSYAVTEGLLVSDDSFTGVLERASGEDVGIYSISQGTLMLSTNYDMAYVAADFSITARPITVSANAATKTYGEVDPVLSYAITEGLLVSGDSFTGELERVSGEDVGIYSIGQGTLALSTNYAMNFVPADFSITSRPITVVASAATKVYGGGDPDLLYTITEGSLADGDAFSGSLLRATGENVGTYVISQGGLTLDGNYQLSYTPSDFTITAREVTITADAKSKVYGSADPLFTYQITGGTLAFNDAFTGALSRVAGESVGSYAILEGSVIVNSNYTITYVGANQSIVSAALTVKANNVLIEEGQTPVFTATITGYVFGDTQGSVIQSGPAYTVSGNYANPGVYIITPSVGLFSPANYVVTIQTGTLYVNPDSRNMRSIKPVLRCVEELVNHPTKFTFLAHFDYENLNAEAVYVPVGTDNSVTGLGNFLVVNQVELFTPGSGSFDVLFNGEKVTWTLKTFDRNKKTSIGSDASSTSNRCQSGTTTARFVDEEPVAEVAADKVLVEIEDIVAYPNPTLGRVVIKVEGLKARPASADLQLIDRIGRSFPVRSTWHETTGEIEVDLSDLDRGLYIIRINTANGVKTTKVMKANE